MLSENWVINLLDIPFLGECVEERMNSGAEVGGKDLLYHFTDRQQKNHDIMRSFDVYIEANTSM